MRPVSRQRALTAIAAIFALLVAFLVAAPASAAPSPDKKTVICHVPPGNPDNAHTIVVGNAAVPAHLAHGDSLGECGQEPPSDPPQA